VTGGEVCADPLTDHQYCGSNCAQCTNGATCQGGLCSSTSICTPGLTLCGTSCVDINSDPYNCGSCGKTCGTLDPSCSAGKCSTLGCASGLKGCSPTTNPKNLTACADETSDPKNCGGCNNACNPGEICSASACETFVYASASWECGLGNALTKFCPNYKICVGASVACPP